MRKPKNIAGFFLFAFIGILAMPLLSTPTAPPLDHHKSNMAFFENGDEHASQWLIRSISESEEFNTRADNTNTFVLLFIGSRNYHSTIHKVWFAQTNERKGIEFPKERIYLSNSCFTI